MVAGDGHTLLPYALKTDNLAGRPALCTICRLRPTIPGDQPTERSEFIPVTSLWGPLPFRQSLQAHLQRRSHQVAADLVKRPVNSQTPG